MYYFKKWNQTRVPCSSAVRGSLCHATNLRDIQFFNLTIVAKAGQLQAKTSILYKYFKLWRNYFLTGSGEGSKQNPFLVVESTEARTTTDAGKQRWPVEPGHRCYSPTRFCVRPDASACYPTQKADSTQIPPQHEWRFRVLQLLQHLLQRICVWG